MGVACVASVSMDIFCMLFSLFERVEIGTPSSQYPRGQTLASQANNPGPQTDHNARLLPRVIVRPLRAQATIALKMLKHFLGKASPSFVV